MKDSNGGTISLFGEQVLFSNATLAGAAGGRANASTTAHGGRLVIGSNRSLAQVTDSTQPTDPVLILAATAPGFKYAGLGKAVTDTAGKAYGNASGFGLIWFGADAFTNGGFGSLKLTTGTGALQVQGSVSLAAARQIEVADGGVLSFVADPKAPTVKPLLSLAAPRVVLGRPFQGPLQAGEPVSPFSVNVVPTYGTGSLAVTAGALIDVGNLVLNGAGAAVLDATGGGTTNGAIRGDGTFDVAGAITLKAGQIYPPTATTFNVVASDYTLNGVAKSGSVTIQASASPAPAALPLSAGGSLNIFASVIDQGGVLRAPQGTIHLGTSGGTDPLSGADFSRTTTLTLEPGSITSVAAIDPVTGQPVTVPYGINVNGDTWVDPTGTDITNSGPAAKAIALDAAAIDFKAATTTKGAARIDLGGGGDLSAYQFVAGTGGKSDVLLGSLAAGFAVVPGYQDAFAPFAPFDTSTAAAASLGSDPGYVVGNAKLGYAVGDRIHLEAAGGLPAGDYTLLPARYALLPGAFLVTPLNTAVTAGAAVSVTQADGSTVASGYRFNGLDRAGSAQTQFHSFEVAAKSVVLKRAEYDTFSANTFFTTLAADSGKVAPRLPADAGQLVLAVTSTLRLQGLVATQAATGGRGGLIDISSAADIFVGSKAAIAKLSTAAAGSSLLLDVDELNAFGAASLLIGGTRTKDSLGTIAEVKTNSIIVDNAGDPLVGADVILAANQGLELRAGAEIGRASQAAVAEPLRVTGSATLADVGSGLNFTHGGQPIRLPEGTGNGQLVATSAGSVTDADGNVTRFAATTTGDDNTFAVPAGATVTLDAAGSVAYASSDDEVARPIPVGRSWS